MAQQVRALAAPLQDVGWVPSNQKVAHNYLKYQFKEFQSSLLPFIGTACIWCIDTHAGKTHKTDTSQKIFFKIRQI